MPEIPPIPAVTWILAALFFAAAILIYTRVIQHLTRLGGRVRADIFDLPELLMSVVLAGSFAMLMISSIQRQTEDEGGMKIDSVVPSSLLFVIMTGGLLAFLHFGRRLPLGQLFGLGRLGPLPALGWAAGLLLAAFPLTGLANALTLLALGNNFTPQPLIELFSEVARENDHLAVAKIFVAGVIIAPCCEEFLFRGFFYGVWKRYFGPLWAGLLACALFAAFHTSLPALAGLFVLAICLTLAYERTGSLLVPIGMHALFNFTSLVFLYVQARFTVIVGQ